MPAPMVRGYASMVPRLQAEEMLRAIRSVALGSGGVKDGDRQVRELQRQASSLPGGRRRAGTAEMTAFAQSLGIPVKQA